MRTRSAKPVNQVEVAATPIKSSRKVTSSAQQAKDVLSRSPICDSSENSISSLNTTITMVDYSDITTPSQPSKRITIETSSIFSDDSCTRPLIPTAFEPTKAILPVVAAPLDFKQFLDETQQEKLAQQLAKKKLAASQSTLSLSTAATQSLSASSRSLIDSILNKTYQQPIAATLSSSISILASSILSKPSMKEKYNSLIADIALKENTPNAITCEAPLPLKPLSLPSIYQILLNAFIKFEDCLKMFQTRDKVPLFNDLKQNMELSMRSTISLIELRQIVTIDPSLYTLKWMRTPASSHSLTIQGNGYSLSVLIGKRSSSDSKAVEFRQKLESRVRDSHQSYLSSVLKIIQKDIPEDKVHAHFNEDLYISNILPAPLPDLPNAQPIDGSKPRANDVLSRILASKSESDLLKSQQKATLMERSKLIISEQSSSLNQSGLSEKLYSLIRAKEQILAEARAKEGKTKANENDMYQRIPDIKKFVEITIVYYMQRKVSNIFKVNLLEHIVSTTSSSISLSLGDAEKVLEFLLANCSFWITRIPNKQGDIIRIDRAVVISKVLAAFDN